jgi:hypothetical protein
MGPTLSKQIDTIGARSRAAAGIAELLFYLQGYYGNPACMSGQDAARSVSPIVVSFD